MWVASSAASFLAGYTCRSGCGALPCKGQWRAGSAGRPFKLSIIVHSATLEDVSSPGMVHDQRPYVSLRVGDKTKETELGDWDKEKSLEKGRWYFRETITLEVSITDELHLDVSCSTKYELWVASITLNSTHIGEVAFPVFSVFPKMKPEDRDDAGIVYATPVIPIDVSHKGKITARLYLSFETNQAPPSRSKHSREDQCWSSCEEPVACQGTDWTGMTSCVGGGCVEDAEGAELFEEALGSPRGPSIGLGAMESPYQEEPASFKQAV
eukprot:TRINITY_DN90774_c0_g1_i1.p1 TRINITY_DN90774_c0_g1~~TRINITY_DN90774_c0_g1_i1.p1  ORF type:complete len:268 (-),score=62.79 TRINITY_DN90774_c0_g1_i1:135-938(-)